MANNEDYKVVGSFIALLFMIWATITIITANNKLEQGRTEGFTQGYNEAIKKQVPCSYTQTCLCPQCNDTKPTRIIEQINTKPEEEVEK